MCTENSASKLCRNFLLLREQLESVREQLKVIPRLEKKLEEQKKGLSSTDDNLITLSTALADTRQTVSVLPDKRTQKVWVKQFFDEA